MPSYTMPSYTMPRRSRSRWRTVAILALILQLGVVEAIVATFCSSENTSNGPSSAYYQMSEGFCRNICSPDGIAGFAFSVTQGKYCWCSDITPGDTTSLSNCNFPCLGFPYEFCGSPSAGLFNYLALGVKPKGTSGGFTPKPSPEPTAASTPKSSKSTSPPAEQTTISDTVARTVVHTIAKTVVTTKVKSIHGSIVTQKPTTIFFTKTVVTDRPPPSTSLQSLQALPATSDSGTTIVISSRVTVVRGITTTEVSLETIPPASGSTPPLTETHTGLSGGAIAGIVIGVVALVVIIAALIYFCCWRPRRNDRNTPESGGERGLDRDTSIISTGGRLRTGSSLNFPSSSAAAGSGPVTVATAASTVSNRPPRLQTDIPNVSGGPSSAATIGTMMSRRDSRPIFVDQRLNTNALLTLENPSRTSIDTLQDNHDYSRPLEVRNP